MEFDRLARLARVSKPEVQGLGGVRRWSYLGLLVFGMVSLATACQTWGAADGLGDYHAASATSGLATYGSAPEMSESTEQIHGALDEFTMRVQGTPVGETSQDIEQRIRREFGQQEAYIASCMAEFGFTYTPRQITAVEVRTYSGPPIGSLEFATQWGFGIADQPLEMMMAGDGFTAQDPNFGIRALMSEAELVAWNEALYGSIFTAPDEPLDLTNQGCTGRADLATLGVWTRASLSPTNNPEFSAIEDEVFRFPDSIAIDPQMIALDTEWAVCMANVGFSGLSGIAQMRVQLTAEWWDILLNADTLTDTQGGGGLDLNTDPAEAFRNREIQLALADVACREQLDFDARTLAIEHLLQQQFVAVFANELEAWAGYAESRRDS